MMLLAVKPSAHKLDSTRFGLLAYIRAVTAIVRRQSSSIIKAVAVDASRQPSGSHRRSQMPASMSSSKGSMWPCGSHVVGGQSLADVVSKLGVARLA
jgi:hypothetical protein